MQETLVHSIESKGNEAPWLFLALFVAASFLMIWRLEAMSSNGFEGTVLGTLVMPYCSGFGNLTFAFILGRNAGNGADVMTNSLVNNVTNMTSCSRPACDLMGHSRHANKAQGCARTSV